MTSRTCFTPDVPKIPILSIGFRPFFFLTALIAVINPTIWVSVYKGYSSIEPIGGPLYWHAHEMFFGMTSALFSGFLLTASANWTGTRPVQGFPLLLLVLFWLLERVSYFLSIGEYTFLFLSNIYLPVFLVILAIRLFDHPKQRNIFIPIILSFFVFKLFHSIGYIEANESYISMGESSSVALIRFLIFLIAGRVLPFFTRKRLGMDEFDFPEKIKMLPLVPLVLLCIPGIIFYPIPYSTLLVVAITMNIYRNYRLWVPGVLSVPLLLVLHIGLYLLVTGMIFELVSIYIPSIDSYKEVLHASMAGGLGVVAIGFMSRVSLGHTGRAIIADKCLQLAFLFVFVGAILRFEISPFLPESFEALLHYSSGFWTLGFLIYLIRVFRALFYSRPDGKPY